MEVYRIYCNYLVKAEIAIHRRFRKTAESDCYLRHVCPAESALNNSAATGRIFMKFGICVIFEDMSRRIKINYNLPKITGTLHSDRYTIFDHISLIYS
jgi:hypothetical protein